MASKLDVYTFCGAICMKIFFIKSQETWTLLSTKLWHNNDSFQLHKLKWIQKVKPGIMALTEYGQWARDKKKFEPDPGVYLHTCPHRSNKNNYACMYLMWRSKNCGS